MKRPRFALLLFSLVAACANPGTHGGTVSPLVVLSYNIHYGVGVDGEYDLERIAAVIADASPDLVGLQEIGDKGMAEELSRLTGMRAIFGPSKGSDEAYGDAVLCRHPFEWVGNVSLPSASSSRYQAMAVDVDVSSLYGPGASVRFVNTHFDWTDSIGSQESRRAAVTVIERAFFDAPVERALLAGDLNAVPTSPPLEDLLRAKWWLPSKGQPMATHGAPAPTKQIDYVLVAAEKHLACVGRPRARRAGCVGSLSSLADRGAAALSPVIGAAQCLRRPCPWSPSANPVTTAR